MPHKRNPISPRPLPPRQARPRYAFTSLENVPLWTSATSRIPRPSGDRPGCDDRRTSCCPADALVDGMEVRPESMRRNSSSPPRSSPNRCSCCSSRAGSRAITPTPLVQPHALAASGAGRFLALVLDDHAITRTREREGAPRAIDVSHALRYVDVLFERVFGKS